MLSKELEQTLNDAFRSARSRRHEFMTVEHLLLALLDNNDAIRVLKACGAKSATCVAISWSSSTRRRP
jgi:ATP-dependent Clp protease ATP-binding subunit ClpA